MSMVALGMNLILAGLLVSALIMGMGLNARLKALRDSHDSFALAVADLDAAAARAEQGLSDLRAATDEATDLLADRIDKARALSAKLDRQMPASGGDRPRPVAEAVEGPDVERVARRLGSLLSAAREPRPRPEPARAGRRETPARVSSRFEDELFDGPPMQAGRGGR